jgi:acetyl-CoA carboxylase biotin carboxyl carrier protein
MAMDVNLEQIKALAELAAEKGLAELTVSDGDKSVTLKMPSAIAQTVIAAPAGGYAPSSQFLAAPAPAMPISNNAPTPSIEPTAEAGKIITAPMVGTFYRSSSPETAPFVEVGSEIRVGQTLCIIEAMKQMNELESEVGGKVVAILVENGQPIEYGQPLFRVV